MTHYLEAAERAARAAGELLRANFQQPLRVNSSEAHDIKLEIDVQSQELITRLLLKEFPEHALYGEEGIVGDQTADYQWVVDPIDGTVNYFYGIPHFCISIALRQREEIIVGVIYDPMRDEMWAVRKGEAPLLNGKEFRVSERNTSRRSGRFDWPFENKRDDRCRLAASAGYGAPGAQMPLDGQRRARHGVRRLRTIRRLSSSKASVSGMSRPVAFSSKAPAAKSRCSRRRIKKINTAWLLPTA